MGISLWFVKKQKKKGIFFFNNKKKYKRNSDPVIKEIRKKKDRRKVLKVHKRYPISHFFDLFPRSCVQVQFCYCFNKSELSFHVNFDLPKSTNSSSLHLMTLLLSVKHIELGHRFKPWTLFSVFNREL